MKIHPKFYKQIKKKGDALVTVQGKPCLMVEKHNELTGEKESTVFSAISLELIDKQIQMHENRIQDANEALDGLKEMRKDFIEKGFDKISKENTSENIKDGGNN